jgi:uncharacterized protein YjdB/alpha-tubulin suppressor-like RCC1 family protein
MIMKKLVWAKLLSMALVGIILLTMFPATFATAETSYLEMPFKTMPMVAVGQSHIVGLTANGTVVAAGNNSFGETNVISWHNIIYVAAGGHHTVGVKSDGTVIATGINIYGQCDISTWTDIIAVSAGFGHTVGLKKDGTVVAVGYNYQSQCRVSEWTDIVAVSAGAYHTVGLKRDGTVIAVGLSDSGQCRVSSWVDIIAISAGASHTVGLKRDGTVVSCGANNYGQSNISQWSEITSISAGDLYTLGIKQDGTLVAVGDNRLGQRDIEHLVDIVYAAAGKSCTIALKSDGTVVGAGNRIICDDVSSWNNIAEIHAGGTFTLGLTLNGNVLITGGHLEGNLKSVFSWKNIIAISVGDFALGLKSDGTVVSADPSAIWGRSEVSSWKAIKAISAGFTHSLGIKSDGTVVAVGNNDNGQCDVSTWIGIKAIAAGSQHSVGLREDGTVVAVGLNGYGQCNVSAWKDIVAISAGTHHTVGLKSDGTVVAVGNNNDGHCDVSSWTSIVEICAGNMGTFGLKADGTTVVAGSSPFDYGQYDLSSWTDIVAISSSVSNGIHTVGLKSNGTVVATGNSNYYAPYPIAKWDLGYSERFFWPLEQDDTLNFLRFLYNDSGKTKTKLTDDEIKEGNHYKLITGQFRDNPDKEDAVKIAFLLFVYSQLNNHIEYSQYLLEYTRLNLQAYFERQINKEPPDLPKEIYNNVANNILNKIKDELVDFALCKVAKKTGLYSLNEVENIKAELDLAGNIYSAAMDLPNKIEKFVDAAVAAVNGAFVPLAAELTGRYQYFSVYLDCRRSIGTPDSDAFQAALSGYYNLIISNTSWAAGFMNCLPGTESWTKHTDTINRWAEFVYQLELSVSSVTSPIKPLQFINLNKTTTTLNKEESETLTVSYTPVDTTDDTTITWSTSDSNIAIVNNGTITAQNPGTAIITAKTGNKESSCTVTVLNPLTSISLNKSTVALNKGQTEALTVIYNPADTTDDRTVTWSSSDSHVATVTNGTITAKNPGTAIITATVGSENTGCLLTVKSPLDSIVLNKLAATIVKGETDSLTVIYMPSDTTDDKTVTWSTSDSNIATVSNGVVTAKNPGRAIITAKVGTKEAICTVTITSPLASISLNKSSIAINKGNTETLTVLFNPADTTDDTTVTWSSSDSNIAAVSNGTLMAKRPGTVTITAKAGTKEATCTVIVLSPLTSISLNKSATTIIKNQMETLTASYNPADTTDDKMVIWTTSDSNIATVSGGIVTAKNPGAVTITAKVGNKESVCTVIVVSPLDSIGLNTTTLSLEKGETETLAILFNPADTTDSKAVTWSTSNAAVADVIDGIVTAKNSGSATITATVGEHQIFCAVIVTDSAADLVNVVYNNDTDIFAESPDNSFPQDLKLEVEILSSIKTDSSIFLKSSKHVVYDIYLLLNGERIQPDLKVKVSIPLPAGFDPTFTKVYYVAENGDTTDMNAVLIDGRLVFETDHFSLYSVVQLAVNADNTVNQDTNNTTTNPAGGTPTQKNNPSARSEHTALPATGDNRHYYYYLLALIASGCALLLMSVKKHEKVKK